MMIWMKDFDDSLISKNKRFTIQRVREGYILTDILGKMSRAYRTIEEAKNEAENRIEDDAYECAYHAYTGQ